MLSGRLARALATASLVCAVAAAILLSASAGAERGREIVGTNIKHPDFSGRFGGEGRLLIKVDQTTRSGEPLRGLFQPKDITLNCIGGGPSEKAYRLPPYRIYFHGNGRKFEGQDFSIDGRGYEMFVLIQGAFDRRNRKADGDIVIEDNPTQANDEQNCFTGGRRPWAAKRG